MDEKTLAEQLRRNPAMLQGLMNSPDGQTLMRMLTRQDQGAGLQRAVQSAVQGNPAQIKQMMDRIMSTPEGAQLVQRISKAVQK